MLGVVSQDFEKKKQRVRDEVERFLTEAFAKYPDHEVRQVAEYAVLGGGHRWRPIAAVAAGEIFREDAFDIVLPGACGAELAHAASLILDDLPSMDDASYRRGKPAAHLAFPGWAVDMAPAFLITMAYDISLANEKADPANRIESALDLCRAGLDMIAGQVLDVTQAGLSDVGPDNGRGKGEARLLNLYSLKSGALYASSARAGAVLCAASREDADIIFRAAMKLGLAYQFMDDVADIVADVDEVGKQAGMDAEKVTSIDLFGVDGAKMRAKAFQDEGSALLERFGAEANWLRSLIQEASWKTR